jgi:hypothetical protein
MIEDPSLAEKLAGKARRKRKKDCNDQIESQLP